MLQSGKHCYFSPSFNPTLFSDRNCWRSKDYPLSYKDPVLGIVGP